MKHIHRMMILWILLLGAGAAGAASEQLRGEREAADHACYNELAAAHCDRAGKPLKCLSGYQKQHHDFRVSDSCAAARAKVREGQQTSRDER